MRESASVLAGVISWAAVAVVCLSPSMSKAASVTACNTSAQDFFVAILERLDPNRERAERAINDWSDDDDWEADGRFYRVPSGRCVNTIQEASPTPARRPRNFYYYAWRLDGPHSGGDVPMKENLFTWCMRAKDPNNPTLGYSLSRDGGTPLTRIVIKEGRVTNESIPPCHDGVTHVRKVNTVTYGPRNEYIRGQIALSSEGENVPIRSSRQSYAPTPPPVTTSSSRQPSTTATTPTIAGPSCPSGQHACGTRCYILTQFQCDSGLLCPNGQRACITSPGVGACYSESAGYVCRGGRVCKQNVNDPNCR